jgi:hypothetical protein
MRFDGPKYLFGSIHKVKSSKLKNHYEVDLRRNKFSEFKAICENL